MVTMDWWPGEQGVTVTHSVSWRSVCEAKSQVITTLVQCPASVLPMWLCDIMFLYIVASILVASSTSDFTLNRHWIRWFRNLRFIIYSHGYPSKHKTFVWPLFNVGPTSNTLGRRCTNAIQMFFVCWDLWRGKIEMTYHAEGLIYNYVVKAWMI